MSVLLWLGALARWNRGQGDFLLILNKGVGVEAPIDVPMGGIENDQAPRQSTPKEVHEATQVMRKSMEDQDHCPAVLISKNSNLVTLIT